MKNGLYAATFTTPLGAGTGVVTLLNGHLSGGDAGMFYVGTYEVNGDNFSARVKTGRHAHTPGSASVFGRDVVTIDLKGTGNGESLVATGSAAEAPGISFQVALKLLAVGG